MTSRKIFFILIFTFFFSFPFPGTAFEKEAVTQIDTAEKLFTVIEFESTFMNRRKEEVLKILGEPDNKDKVQDKEVWKYKQVVKDKEKIWDQNIMFDFGRVNYIWSDNGK